MAKAKAEQAEVGPEVVIEDIEDYPITIRVRGGSLHEKTFTFDLYEAKLLCEEMERKYRTFDKGWKAPFGFLTEFAEKFDRLGLKGCTPTMAFQLWAAVTKAWAGLKKNTQESQTSPDSTDATLSN